MYKLRQILLRARKAKRMTQRQAAACAHVSLKTVTNVETGMVIPNTTTLYKLSVVYGLDLSQLQKIALQEEIERIGSKSGSLPIAGAAR